MDRRNFIRNSGLLVGASATLATTGFKSPPTRTSRGIDYGSWQSIREQFPLTTSRIHMSQMLLASHPTPVREAIEMHRKKFDENPFEYWEEIFIQADQKVCDAAARYMDVLPEEVALTDSTTMGLGILYNGLILKKGDEIVTTTHDHYSTEKSLEFAAAKTGAIVKRVSLYDNPSAASTSRIVETLIKAITPKTKVIAITWVHSVTGVKLPVRQIADALAPINNQRSKSDKILLCVDGVHGFGVDNITMKDMGCDFFVAGTHKWMFGPRGTGILWGRKDVWDRIAPIIPAFREQPYYMWMGVMPEGPITFTQLCSPGGFFAFEHRWSLNEAFDFHLKIGKDKIHARSRELNDRLKSGLKQMKHIKLYTPQDPNLSCAINCFDVVGMKPKEVIDKLLSKNILASTTPYKTVYARLTPSVINTEEEVDLCLKALEGFAM